MTENNSTKQRLLIVDDSRVIRVTARKILQNHFETVEAVDGANAWELLNAGPAFSVIVSDLTMPNLDGFGLLEKIRTSHDPEVSGIPVIIITGANDSETTMQRARDAGATDFIGKPFDAVHLLARTQAHASAYVSRRSLSEHALSLEDLALVDTQTGLANETAFMDRGFQQLSYAIRHNTRLAITQVEIDHFGKLFREHGKPVADMVIDYAATVLQSGIRQEDLVARIGTARFAMLLPGMDPSGVRRLTDRMVNDMRNRVVKSGNQRLRFTVSIGIAAPEIRQDTRLETLLAAAGTSLRDAINAGGDCAVIHDPAGTNQPATPDTGNDHASTGLDDATVAGMISQHIESHPPTGKDRTSEVPGLEAARVSEIYVDELPGISMEPELVAGTETDALHMDEEIVITSPYSLFEEAPASVAEQPAAREKPEVTDAKPAVITEQVSVESHAEAELPVPPRESVYVQASLEENEQAEIPRPGLWRRLVSLFTRSPH
jgi:two-component system cell cycle response regulator